MTTWITKIRICFGLVMALGLIHNASFAGESAPAATEPTVDAVALVKNAAPVALPADIVWETNDTDPPIGSPNAIRGGRFNTSVPSFPVTYRLMGPNNNDSFATWGRMFALMDKQGGLVTRHPNTDNFIPILATHWSVQKDQQTIYFKLDRDAKWSDGEPVTANDYVFTWRMMQSKFIVDPFFNTYVEREVKSVDRIDDYTLRIVGMRPSWRPLADYGGFWPMPMHSTVLDKDWVDRTNNEPLIVPGPYVLSNSVLGESVTFKRVPNWWGDKKRYFVGLYNFDEIHIRFIQPDRELDYLRQGELDTVLVPGKIWKEGLDFPAVQNGWLKRARPFVEMPSGIVGLQMNLEAPIFQNKEFRIALQYLLNFDRINLNLLYGEAYRVNSFFEGTEFANPAVKSRSFDPAKAHEYLERAGYHRPAHDESFLGRLTSSLRGLIFPRTDTDDIFVNDKGEKAQFTLTYYYKSLERHLTLIQQDFRRAGVDMRLQQLEPGAAFQRALERKFEMMLLAMQSNFYPDPRQYLHTDFKNSKNNNDFWGYGTQEVDDLVKVYEENLDANARRDAMYRIDQIVHDEAFYIPFWTASFFRMLSWDYLQFPDFYLPKRTDQTVDWLVYWIDPAKKAALEKAMKDNTPYPVEADFDKDYFGVKQKKQ